MKTERRHELQTNDLASWLTEWIEQVKPHSKRIMGAVVLIFMVVFAVAFVRGRGTQGREAAWTAYFNANSKGDVEGFDAVAQAYPETDVALWALLTSGDRNLEMGFLQLFRNRDAGVSQLENARDIYQKAVDASKSSDNPMIHPRALGLAQALESLGEVNEAKARYQEVVDGKEWADSPVVEMARERVEAIELPSSSEWYRWFAEQKPIELPLETPGMYDNLPNLPDNPDINFPKPGELLKPDGGDTGSGPEVGSDAFDEDPAADDALPATDGDSADDIGDAPDDPGPTLIDPASDSNANGDTGNGP